MLRKRNSTLKAVKELDAFPKIPDNYTVTTASGGTVSIISFLLIFVLVVSEIRNYSSSVKFKYDIDADFDSKLQINIDVTVAMPCDSVGADVLDVTKQNSQVHGKLEEDEVHFELTRQQRLYFDTMKQLNLYIREQYHSVQEVLWKEGYVGIVKGFPSGENLSGQDSDACRLHGVLLVNKVSGNFHITAGKHIPHPMGHAHISMFLKDKDYNFSHRIEGFSFGEPHKGLFDPLEGDEKIASENFHIYQYYIKVVPTEVMVDGKRVHTYQYSVTEQDRAINHGAGSHGVPGIYFKYDLSPVKVIVIEEQAVFWHFLVRLCGIVGGIYATSGLLNYLVSFAVHIINCKLLKHGPELNPSNTGTYSEPLHPGLMTTPSMLGDEFPLVTPEHETQDTNAKSASPLL